jgi:phage gpG-like protein
MIRVDTRQAEQMMARATYHISGPGLRAIAEQIAEDLYEYAMQAFAQQRDPSTGAAWPEPAPRTLADRGFRQLLQRSGALRGSIRTRVVSAEGGATAMLTLPESGEIIRRGLVHLFGARRKKGRGSYRVPARPWLGYPMGAVKRWDELIIRASVGEGA